MMADVSNRLVLIQYIWHSAGNFHHGHDKALRLEEVEQSRSYQPDPSPLRQGVRIFSTAPPFPCNSACYTIFMFQRVILTIFLSCAFILVGTLPLISQAQTAFDPGTIVPQCGYFSSDNSTFHECTLCDFMQLVRNVLNFILFLTMVSSGALFAWAGWLFATSGDNPGNLAKGKGIFKSVIIGLVLVIGAYTIVNTLMKMLVSDNFGDISTFTTSWSVICPQSGGATPYQQQNNF